jgi:hypothetical protein
MKKSVRIQMGESVMSKPYTLRMNYNPVELQCRDAADALCLNIYAFETNDDNKVYSESCFQPIAECQVNSDLNTIQACFDKAGLFVVGKRK